MDHEQYEEERQHQEEHDYHMGLEGEAMAQNEQEISEAYQARLKQIKKLEAGIDKLIIHYEVLSRVSYADSFNSKLLFEKFVEDLKKILKVVSNG